MESQNRNPSFSTSKSVVISQSFYDSIFREVIKSFKFPKQIKPCEFDIVFSQVAICVTTLGDVRRNFKMLRDQLDTLATSMYRYRVMMVYLDEDNQELLTDINLEAFHANVALFLASDTNELVNYIETLCTPSQAASKAKKIPCKEVLTRIKGITKRDSETLYDRFGNMKGILQQTEQDFKSCPGIGRLKARNLAKCFNEAIKRV
jgi:DNA integrity scanning protein DisA with diadenylate cyclase activity